MKSGSNGAYDIVFITLPVVQWVKVSAQSWRTQNIYGNGKKLARDEWHDDLFLSQIVVCVTHRCHYLVFSLLHTGSVHCTQRHVFRSFRQRRLSNSWMSFRVLDTILNRTIDSTLAVPKVLNDPIVIRSDEIRIIFRHEENSFITLSSTS